MFTAEDARKMTAEAIEADRKSAEELCAPVIAEIKKACSSRKSSVTISASIFGEDPQDAVRCLDYLADNGFCIKVFRGPKPILCISWF